MKLAIPCNLRAPLTLESKSCHLELSSLSFQSGPQQAVSFTAAVKALNDAFESRNFEGLFQTTINYRSAEGITKCLTLSSANSQLHALNRDTRGFKYGYEPEVAAVLDYFVDPSGTFVDVGANFGYFSLYLASRHSFCGAIHAFEPSTRGFSDLNRLVSGFDLADRIHIHQVALGDSQKDVELLLSNSDGLSTTVSAMANRIEKVVRSQMVAQRTLDDFSFSKVDFIKIDVEGAEGRVIAGGIATIEANRPVIAFESWTGADTDAPFAGLSDLGYRFFLPAWANSAGQMCMEIEGAADPSMLELVLFERTERAKLPERLNVVAIPDRRVEQMLAGNDIRGH